MFIRKINFLVSLLLICLFHSGYTQPSGLYWMNSFGSADEENVSSIAVDDSGNVYSSGYFRGTMDFDPGPGNTASASQGNEDIFICKHNEAGDLVWVKTIGSIGFDWGTSIAIKNEHIYVGGFFNDTVDFDPDSGAFLITTAGLNDAFILKLDNSGNFIWAKAMGGTGSDAGSSLAVDDSENVYITGSYNGSGDFDPDSTATYTLNSNGELEFFIAKLDSAGIFRWAKSIGGTEDDQTYFLTVDEHQNVYATGYFEKTVDFDPGPGVYNISSAGNLPDAFILKLNGDGDFKWAKATKGLTSNVGYSLAIDGEGNVYSVGTFLGTIDFDPDSTTIYNITSAGGYDVFISKSDSLGNFIWAKQIGGIDDDQGFTMTLDSLNNIYLAGIFSATADFDPDPVLTYNKTARAGFDFFISLLDSAGNFIWTETGGGNNRDQVHTLFATASGELYAGGYFYSSSMAFFGDTLVNSNLTGLSPDIFIARLGNTFTGIKTLAQSNQSFIYPNPAQNSVTVKINSQHNEKYFLSIDDLSGRNIYRTNMNGDELRIDVSGFIAGVYVLNILSEHNKEVRKLVVRD